MSKARKALTGRKIVEIRDLSAEELGAFGWYQPGLLLVLDDGSSVVVSADPEGNGPGALFYFGVRTGGKLEVIA